MQHAEQRGVTSALSDEDVGPRVIRGGLQRSIGFVVANLLAVAGAIRDLAPDVELVAVRIFDTTLATTARLLCQAIDWAS